MKPLLIYFYLCLNQKIISCHPTRDKEENKSSQEEFISNEQPNFYVESLFFDLKNET